jgi:hypothetical protein
VSHAELAARFGLSFAATQQATSRLRKRYPSPSATRSP